MDDSSLKRRRRLPIPGWALSIIAFMLIVTPLGANAARQLAPSGGSPATGHAQVVTQGIAKINADQVVWRLVERTARPRWLAIPARKTLSFIFASEEPVLLSNVAGEKLNDVARLATGEAMWVPADIRTVRASLTDKSTKYFALELVPAAGADDVGSGKLLFKSGAFNPPSGERDLDLVRNVLAAGESATVPDSGQQNVIFATEGAIDVVPANGRKTRLETGESLTFTGELEIQTAQPSAGTLPISAMTAYLAQDQPSRAAYVVAVIGEEIPPPTTPTPTPTETPIPTATFTSTPLPTVTPTETATIPPTETPIPTDTSTPAPTDTPVPTDTPTPPDGDGDGLSDADERLWGTNPNVPDSDGDGLLDGEEVHTYLTEPTNRDTDGDGLMDGEEVNKYETDPLNADTDGDKCTDGYEVRNQYDPINPKDCSPPR
jgi:Bacterial TSP3 repeat